MTRNARRRRNAEAKKKKTLRNSLIAAGSAAALTIGGLFGYRAFRHKMFQIPDNSKIVDDGREGNTAWAVFETDLATVDYKMYGWSYLVDGADGPVLSDGGYMTADSAREAVIEELQSGEAVGFDPQARRTWTYQSSGQQKAYDKARGQ